MTTLTAEDARRYSDDFRATGMDFEVSGCYVLGKDLGGFVNAEERRALENLIGIIRDESDGGFARARMLAQGPRTWKNDPKALLERVAALEAGLE